MPNLAKPSSVYIYINLGCVKNLYYFPSLKEYILLIKSTKYGMAIYHIIKNYIKIQEVCCEVKRDAITSKSTTLCQKCITLQPRQL